MNFEKLQLAIISSLVIVILSLIGASVYSRAECARLNQPNPPVKVNPDARNDQVDVDLTSVKKTSALFRAHRGT